MSCHIAKIDGKIAGFIFQTCCDDSVIIHWLSTAPEFRGKGVASRLIRESLAEASRNGYHSAFVRIPKSMDGFFTRLGSSKIDALKWYEFKGSFISKKRSIGKDPVLYSSTLGTAQEWKEVVDRLDSERLPKHADLQKNWDSFAAVRVILKHWGTDRSNIYILDAGGEFYSSILPQLAAFGYEHLTCINLSIKETTTIGKLVYQHGDATKTQFSDDHFHAVTCLSVIEHGVSMPEFFREMHRILKPHGILFISTDYWHEKTDTKGLTAFGHPITIFDEADIQKVIEEAKRQGFRLLGDLRTDCRDKVVTCDGFEYTFTYFTLQKI